MPFDGLMLAAVCRELNENLAGARIEKIYQPEKNAVTLYLSRPRYRQWLILSAHPRDARAHLFFEKGENPAHPPIFCMVLRKHLEGGHIEEFRQQGLERILDLQINARDELGRPSKKILTCEIMGKHSNILLVNPEENSIIDGIRRYSHDTSRHREVLPGRPYVPPPPQNKINPLDLDENKFREILLNSPLEKKLYKTIQAGIAGLSTVMSREIIHRAGLPEGTVLNYCGEHELRVLWQALESITAPLSRGEFNPTYIEDKTGVPVDYTAYDLNLYENYIKSHGTASEVLDKYFTARKELDRFYAERQSILNILNREIKRLEKKISLQEESAANTEDAEKYRLCGELLSANFYLLEKGQSEIEVDNFYDPELKKMTIPLDTTMTPSENTQAYFKKYTKAKNTRERALEQARKSKEELEYIKGVIHAAEHASQLNELLEIKQELREQGYIDKGKETSSRGKKQKPLESYPRSYISSDGFTILVGQNNKQNDKLTMKTAKSSDIWMHTKEIAGSHVIIKTESAEVPENTIYEGAVIAAYYSRARQSKNVPVDYTYKKHVRKPSRAKPGYVIYENYRTLTVTPDETLVNSLEQNK